MTIDVTAVNDAPIDLSANSVIHNIDANAITVIGSQTGTQLTTATLTSGRTVTVSVVANEVSADIYDASGNLLNTIHVIGYSDSNDLFGGSVEVVVSALPDGGFIVVEKVEGYIKAGHHGGGLLVMYLMLTAIKLM